MAGLALILVWAASALVVGLRVRGELAVAERELVQARTAAGGLDIDGLERHLDRAGAALGEARERLGGPILQAAAALPGVGDDLQAVHALAVGVEGVVEAARAAVAIVGGGAAPLASLLPSDGRVPLEGWIDLAPALRGTAEAAAAARQGLEERDGGALHPTVAAAMARVLDVLGRLEAQADTAATAAEVLPDLLGADGPRTYFLAAGNPAEPRGSGGLMGAWAIAEVDGGRIAIGSFAPIQDLPDLIPSPLPAPEPSVGARYARYGGTGVWRNLNMTPDFPTAALQIEQLYEAVTGVRVDGTVLVDPRALQLLLDPQDVLDVPVIGPVPARRIVRLLVTDAYARIEDAEERKRLLGDVAERALSALLDGGAADAPIETAHRLGEVVDGGHVRVHATDPSVQERLVALGVAGAFGAPSGDLLAVTANDGSATKLGAFVERTITYRVQLEADGAARGHVEVRHTNAVDVEGLPRYVVGPQLEDLGAGEVLLLISTYCAATCRFVDQPGPGWDGVDAVVEDELGHPVSSSWVAMGPGASNELAHRWVIDRAWTAGDDGAGTYALAYRHQAAVAPVRLVLEVTAPPGHVITHAEADGVGPSLVDGAVARWDVEVDGDLSVAVQIEAER